MITKLIDYRFILGLMAVACIALAPQSLFAKENTSLITQKYPATIVVEGRGIASTNADIAYVRFRISEDNYNDIDQKNSEQSTIQRFDKKIKDILSYLNGVGISLNDIGTVDDQVLFARYQGSEGGPDSVSFSQDFMVEVRDLGKVTTLVQGLALRGVEEIHSPTFNVDNDADVSDRARENAIKDARSQAQKVAKQLGVTIDRLQNYYESEVYYAYDVPYTSPIPAQNMQMEVEVSVFLTYEVK